MEPNVHSELGNNSINYDLLAEEYACSRENLIANLLSKMLAALEPKGVTLQDLADAIELLQDGYVHQDDPAS